MPKAIKINEFRQKNTLCVFVILRLFSVLDWTISYNLITKPCFIFRSFLQHSSFIFSPEALVWCHPPLFLSFPLLCILHINFACLFFIITSILAIYNSCSNHHHFGIMCENRQLYAQIMTN